MDIWFSLFVTLVALAAAAGFSLVLVGYINVLPASVGGNRNWLRAVLVVPAAIVAVPAALSFMIMPFYADMIPPGRLAGWLAIPAAVIHVAALAYFLSKNWQEQGKTGKQLGFGLLLLVVAVGVLYGAGPMFAERVVASIK